MPRTKTGIGVGFCSEKLAKIDAAASKLGRSRTETINLLTDFGLLMLEVGGDFDPRRFLANNDYTQIALDFLIAQQYPEHADRLVALATSRYESADG